MVTLSVLQAIVARSLYRSARIYGVDDAGYMTVLVREWVSRGGLYDRVYSQYGPFHVLVFGVPSWLFGFEVTMERARLMTFGCTWSPLCSPGSVSGRSPGACGRRCWRRPYRSPSSDRWRRSHCTRERCSWCSSPRPW